MKDRGVEGDAEDRGVSGDAEDRGDFFLELHSTPLLKSWGTEKQLYGFVVDLLAFTRGVLSSIIGIAESDLWAL